MLGEAARRVSDSFKEAHQEVPWSDMTGMRNVVIHDYAELDFDALWATINKDLPAALTVIKALRE